MKKLLLIFIAVAILQVFLIQAAQEKIEKLRSVIENLDSPISTTQIEEIESSLDDILRVKHSDYRALYDELFIIQVEREQSYGCCAWWPWRSQREMRIEYDKTARLQEIALKVLQEAKK